MSTPRDNTYYYPNSGRLQSKSPTRGDTQSGSSLPEQGLFSYVNSMYINSDLKSTDVAPSTYASHYTQQRHPQPYDAGYASYPYQAPSQQHQASQYSMYQQQPDPRYAAQQTYTTYPSRTSPPIPADHHRHVPSHAHQAVRDDRWQAQSASYYPQPTSSPQTMTSHGTVRSPQAAYPTQYPQYQPVATSAYPTDPNASRMMAHGQPVASQHHHMQMGHPSVERTVSSRNVASLPYSRGPPVMSPIDYDTAESSAEPTIKKKRKRADPHQLKILNDVYARTAFPSTEERADLAKRLDMSARSVQIWFQNKRQSMRTGGRQGNPSTPTTTSIPPNPPQMPSPPHVYDTSPTVVSPHSMASSSGTHYSSRSPPPTISTRKSPSPPGGRSLDPRKWFSRGGY